MARFDGLLLWLPPAISVAFCTASYVLVLKFLKSILGCR